MKAIQLPSFDGPKALVLGDVAIPDDPDRVLIEVKAAGVSYPDLLFTYGRYQDVPALPYIPGLEVAGVVRRAPAGSGFREGDRVAAATFASGYAEFAAAEPRFTFPIPAGFDDAQGVALVVNYLTAHFSLVRRARLEAGETVLVHGAAGGLGSAVIQIAKGVGARVIAVASTEQKRAACLDAGADAAISPEDGWAARAREANDGRGMDLVYDPVGGDRFTDSLRCLAPDGRVLVMGFAGGGEIPTVKVNRLLLGNSGVLGAVWQTFIPVDPGIIPRAVADITAMAAAGVVRPVLGSRYPLKDAAAALTELEERRAVGKVVLDVG